MVVYAFFHLFFSSGVFQRQKTHFASSTRKSIGQLRPDFFFNIFSSTFACRNVRTRGRRAAAPAQEGAVVGACGGFLSVLRNDLARAPAGGGAPAPRPAHPVASPKRMVPSQRSLLGKHSRGMRRYARVGEPGRPPLRGRVPNRFLTQIRRHCDPRPPPPPPSRPAAARTTAPCSSRRLRPFLYGITVSLSSADFHA